MQCRMASPFGARVLLRCYTARQSRAGFIEACYGQQRRAGGWRAQRDEALLLDRPPLLLSPIR